MDIYEHIYIYIYSFWIIYKDIYKCINTFLLLNIYAPYMYIYIYTYIHTYTYISLAVIIIHTYPSRQLSAYTLHWQFVVPSPRPGLSICRNRSLAVRSLCRYSMFLMSCLCTNLCAYSKELHRKNLVHIL